MAKIISFSDYVTKKDREKALSEEYFDKETVLETMLEPAIDKIAAEAGLDPEKFQADRKTLEYYLMTPFSHTMSDGNTYVPDYSCVIGDVHYMIIFTMQLSDPADYRNSEFALQTKLWKEDQRTKKCAYFGTDGKWHKMDPEMFHFRDEYDR